MGEKLAVIAVEGETVAPVRVADGLVSPPSSASSLPSTGSTLPRIQGTGAGGRITRDDVLAHVAKRGAPQRKTVPFSRIRKVTAERMALSWRTIPHVLQAVEVDFLPVESARLLGRRGELEGQGKASA